MWRVPEAPDAPLCGEYTAGLYFIEAASNSTELRNNVENPNPNTHRPQGNYQNT